MTPELLVFALIVGIGAAPFLIVEWVQRRRYRRGHTSAANLAHILIAEGRQGDQP